MTVELICVGTELLLGNIVNTNAAYLSKQCAALGFSCFFQTVVGDNEERLAGVIKTAAERSDIVILCGGLGPTEDDLTKEVAAKVCGKQLLFHEPSWAMIETYFARRGMVPVESNRKQAMLPEGCIVMENHNGTAPGVIMETEDARLLLFPGPPGELQPMFEESAKPYLEGLTEQVICSRTVKLAGIGESAAESMILDMIDAQTNPTLATYAKTGEVHIRVTAAAADREQAEKLISPVEKELLCRFGNAVYSTRDEVTLEKAVIDLLREKHLTVTCAESCTGGLLSARLINVPGASEVYRAGFVTYAEEAKMQFLDVKGETLKKYTAVSEQTAKEMAEGAAKAAGTDAALAVTGIAGPDGGTKEQPVGLVYIACKVAEKVTVKEYRFSGNRMKIRESAVAAALVLARECLTSE